jgi:molybdopterin synthase catalytic subunit
MIRVQAEDFDVGREMAALRDGNTAIGGMAAFVGLVRDMADGRDVASMTLEHYPGMTEKQIQGIEAEARERWPLEDCLIIHRHGRLKPGDQIVLVITASAHREAAFESAAFLMDWLKTKAPFWKREDGSAGTQWVDARDSDDDAAARWTEAKTRS